MKPIFSPIRMVSREEFERLYPVPDKDRVKKERITKVEFYRLGGFSNSQLFRLQSRGGAWRYYRKVD